MSKHPREVSGFTILPIQFPPTPAFPQQVQHYLYVKPHEPQIPDEDTPRSLFVVNLPTTTTETHLRNLFTQQLGGGNIADIQFSETYSSTSISTTKSVMKSGRKRKRLTAEEIEVGLDSFALPAIFDSHIHAGGSSAVVIFIDKSGMDLTFKAVRRASKGKVECIWGDGVQDRIPRLGLTRYQHHNQLQYPSRKEVLQAVDGYMTAYAQMEEARSRENARKRQLPDEDGFVTVTRGSKGISGLSKEEAAEAVEKQTRKRQGLDNFYRFQLREKRKEQQGEMLRRFEEDRKKVDEMRRRRGIT